MRRVLPIVLQELSLFVLWLMATPIISNYIAVKQVFDPIWYPCVSLGHLIRWWLLYYRRVTPAPALRWLCYVPCLPLLGLWGFILGGEIRIINASYPLAILLFGGLVGVLYGMHRLHGWAVSALFGGLIVATLYYQLYTPAVIYIALAVLFALGGVLFRRVIYQVPVWVAVLALMNVWVVFTLYYFRFVNGTQIAHLSQHPAIERLFVFETDDPVGRIIGKNIMTIEQGCAPDSYLVSSHHGDTGVVLVDHKRRLARGHPSIIEGNNDILVDCTTQQAVVGAFNHPGGLYVIDLQNWPTLSRPMIPIPGRGVVYIIYDRANQQYLVFPKDQVLYAVDVQSGKITGKFRGPDERAYDPRSNELTSLTEPDFSIMRIKIGSAQQTPFQVVQRRSMGIPVYKRLQMYFHPGPQAGTTLVTSLWDGTITLYDRELKAVRQTHIAPGVSGMVLTRDKRYILIGGYTDGNLYFMDAQTWSIVARLYLGHRMRELRLSHDGRFVYVGSSQGGFRIDIERILGRAGTSRAHGGSGHSPPINDPLRGGAHHIVVLGQQGAQEWVPSRRVLFGYRAGVRIHKEERWRRREVRF